MDKQNFFPQLKSLCLFLALYSAAWLLQDRFFLNGDTSYCLHAARLLWNGGDYARDFFNPNPPLILYLQFPVLQLHAWLQGDIALEARACLFLLSFFSFLLCLRLAQGLMQPSRLLFFMSALLLALLFVPLYHFGEREHLLLMLTAPYLLLLACRLQASTHISTGEIFLVALLAAIGFALKPPFLITPLLLELYGLWRLKTLCFCLRLENAVLFLFLLAYCFSLFLFYPDFLFLVLPFVLRNYYQSVGSSWSELLLNPPCLFCYAVLIFSFAQIKTQKELLLRPVLLLSIDGFLIADFAQRTTFFYHALPALALALLLLLLELLELCKKPAGRRAWLLLGLLLLLSFLPLAWQHYSKGREYKEQVLNKLVPFLQKQKAASSLYVFARWGSYAFPIVDYSGSRSAQRFDCLWPLARFLKEEQFLKQFHLEQNNSAPWVRDRDFFISMIADDLARHRPSLVLIDQEDASLRALDRGFNYLDYFSQNHGFRQAWKAYHYLTTLDNYPFYRLLVYQREEGSV